MLIRPLAQVLVCVLTPSFALAQTEAEEGDGFVSIFDGRSLAAWRADPVSQAAAWSVEDGVIRGEGQETASPTWSTQATKTSKISSSGFATGW